MASAYSCFLLQFGGDLEHLKSINKYMEEAYERFKCVPPDTTYDTMIPVG